MPSWFFVGELRNLRRAINCRQHEFARLLDVPLETLRVWDSGRRTVPRQILQRARQVVAERPRQTEWLSLDDLARELGVHPRTLRAAARTVRLAVRFSSRSVFGRPIRYATRADGQRFKATYYRLFGGQPPCPAPLPTVPANYDERLRELRCCLRLSQDALAHRVGAAGKAVVYQWESRKRIPSPVFWRRVEELEAESYRESRRAN